MSIITNNIGMARSLTVDMLDTPLDGRTRVTSIEDFPNIEHPFVGMVIYCTDTPNKLYLVTKLKDKLLGAIPVPNATIDTYVTYQLYSAGTGISISPDGVITCTVTPSGDGGGTTDYNGLVNTPKFYVGRGIVLDTITAGSIIVSDASDSTTNGVYDMVDATATGTNRVWHKSDRKLYHDGEKWVFDDNFDSVSFYYSAVGNGDPWDMTFTAALSSIGSAPTVTRRDNSMVSKYTFTVDTTLVALKSDIITYSEGANITISPKGVISATDTKYTKGDGILISPANVISVDFETVAKKGDIKSYSGSDNISVSSAGVIDVTDKVALKSDITEQNFDYNALDNKPKFIAGDGIKIEVEFAESLIVAGAGNTECNGTYELADHKKKGTARVWQKANRKIYHDGTKWVIDSDADGASFYYSATGEADPWTLTFAAALSEFGNAPTVARATTNSFDRIVFSADFTDVIGDINSILDNINGEVI